MCIINNTAIDRSTSDVSLGILNYAGIKAKPSEIKLLFNDEYIWNNTSQVKESSDRRRTAICICKI